MDKDRECCYEKMTKSVGGQSQEADYHDEPCINNYENTRKYNEGLDWIGTGKK